ncbi:MAG: Lacal_2735 family protein [Bacteroidetes bacterium]|nr:MAG: Lacal_2735 family protein [Bacteroidota bacterium]
MLSWLKPKSKLEKLQLEYRKLMKSFHTYSQSDRAKADEFYSKAEAIAQEIEKLNQAGSTSN